MGGWVSYPTGRAPIQLLPLPPLLKHRGLSSEDGHDESVAGSDSASEVDAPLSRTSFSSSSYSSARRTSGGVGGGGGCPALPRATASSDGDGGGGGGGSGRGRGGGGGVIDTSPFGRHPSPSPGPLRDGAGTGTAASHLSGPESARSADNDKENRVQGRRAPAWEHKGSLGGDGGGGGSGPCKRVGYVDAAGRGGDGGFGSGKKGVEAEGNAAFDTDGRGGGDAGAGGGGGRGGAGGGGAGISNYNNNTTNNNNNTLRASSPTVEGGGMGGGGRARPLESRTIRSVTRSPALGSLDNGRHPSRGR